MRNNNEKCSTYDRKLELCLAQERVISITRLGSEHPERILGPHAARHVQLVKYMIEQHKRIDSLKFSKTKNFFKINL